MQVGFDHENLLAKLDDLIHYAMWIYIKDLVK